MAEQSIEMEGKDRREPVGPASCTTATVYIRNYLKMAVKLVLPKKITMVSLK